MYSNTNQLIFVSVGSNPMDVPLSSTNDVSHVPSTIDSQTTAPSSISGDYLEPNEDADDNSDNDVDSEIFNNGQDEAESFLIKQQQIPTMRKRDAIREKLFRVKETTKDVFSVRTKKTLDKPAADESLNSVPSADIESGVEMVEDMEMPVMAAVGTESASPGWYENRATDVSNK